MDDNTKDDYLSIFNQNNGVLHLLQNSTIDGEILISFGEDSTPFGLITIGDVKKFLENTNTLEEKYYDIGGIAFFTKTQLLDKRTEVEFTPYIVPFSKSIDINNSEDWDLAEKLYLAQRNTIEQ